MAGISIQNLTRHTRSVAGLPFTKVAKKILPDWDISLVFVGPTQARALNKQLRGKSYVPNVLSYTLGDKSAEIIICPSEAAKQAPDYGLLPSAYCLLLFIHGALHIKGWAHGARMEKCERDLVSEYETPHRDRHRHRHLPSKNGGRRRGR